MRPYGPRRSNGVLPPGAGRASEATTALRQAVQTCSKSFADEGRRRRKLSSTACRRQPFRMSRVFMPRTEETGVPLTWTSAWTVIRDVYDQGVTTWNQSLDAAGVRGPRLRRDYGVQRRSVSRFRRTSYLAARVLLPGPMLPHVVAATAFMHH